MMNVARRLLTCIALVVLLCSLGCSTTSTYVTNRLSDLTDVIHVDLNAVTFGILVNVGPLMLGAEGMMNIPDGPAYQFRLGLGGPQTVRLEGDALGFIWPFERQEVVRREFNRIVYEPIPRNDTYYWSHAPGWGSVGVNLGFFFGAGLQADAVELADFVLGFFNVDIVHDDLGSMSYEELHGHWASD